MKRTDHERVDRIIKEIFTLSAYEQHALLSKLFYDLLFDPFQHALSLDNPYIKLKNTSIETIEQTVSGYYDIPVEQLQSKTRLQEIVFARQMIMYLAHKLTRISSIAIGKHFGKDHATVLHAIKRIDTLMAENNHIKKDLYFLSERLKPGESWKTLPALPADSS